MKKNKMTIPDKFYRYEDILVNWDHYHNIPIVKIDEITFKLINETHSGYWIKQISIFPEHERWVSNNSKKRYAYPTKEEAINNFLARKNRQITILDRKLQQAKNAYNQALQIKKQELEKENKNG